MCLFSIIDALISVIFSQLAVCFEASGHPVKAIAAACRGLLHMQVVNCDGDKMLVVIVIVIVIAIVIAIVMLLHACEISISCIHLVTNVQETSQHHSMVAAQLQDCIGKTFNNTKNPSSAHVLKQI
jgi:hypothetical protein